MDAKKARVSLPQWRADFPIRWDDDHYVTRRELAKFLTLGSALLVGANAAVILAGRARAHTTYTPMRIASADALAPGQSLLFRYPTEQDPCILVRTKRGELVAFSQVCTHLSCAVIYRAADDHLYCPCHEGLFACEGARGGAQPIAGPPERPLPRIVLDVRADDVFAIGVEL
jgi:nitrite reductase/ring-hydroxylating ferredoxin subunit